MWISIKENIRAILKLGTAATFGVTGAKIDALKNVGKITKIEHAILGVTNYVHARIADKMVEKVTDKKPEVKKPQQNKEKTVMKKKNPNDKTN